MIDNNDIERENKTESKKCTKVQQEIREAIFYSDNLAIY